MLCEQAESLNLKWRAVHGSNRMKAKSLTADENSNRPQVLEAAIGFILTSPNTYIDLRRQERIVIKSTVEKCVADPPLMVEAALKSLASHRELRREASDLSDLADGIAARLQKATPTWKGNFLIEPGARVEVDESLSLIALENLIGNAWKYTRKVVGI
jgi:hypothetical protein